MKIYLDTSAFVKYYHHEKGSEEVENIFSYALKGKAKLVISLWVISTTVS